LEIIAPFCTYHLTGLF
jgi:hypothetical protein